jgi:hypothetical protein
MVKVGDLYSVSPEATLGPTVREIRDYERKESQESGREPEVFSLQPASEQRRSVDSQERQEYGTVRESAWHARVR